VTLRRPGKRIRAEQGIALRPRPLGKSRQPAQIIGVYDAVHPSLLA
jgi:hypothetical protein